MFNQRQRYGKYMQIVKTKKNVSGRVNLQKKCQK